MRRRRGTLLGIAFLVLSSITMFAELVGKWDSNQNSCACNVLLTIERESDGSLSGKMNFPGAQVAIYNIVATEDHISFMSTNRRATNPLPISMTPLSATTV